MAHNPNVSAMTLEELDRPVGLYNRNIDTTIDDQSFGPVAGPSGVQGRGRGASRPVESEVQMRNRLKGEYDAWYSALLEQRKRQHEAQMQAQYDAEMQAARRADESQYNRRVAGTEQNMHVAFDRDLENERRLLQQQMEAEWAQREAMVDGEDAQLNDEWEEERRRMHAEREAERAWYQGEIHRLRHQPPPLGPLLILLVALVALVALVPVPTPIPTTGCATRTKWKSLPLAARRLVLCLQLGNT